MRGLRVENLFVRYGTRQRVLNAVEDVSFSVAPGAAVGLVGESGSGKSSIARAITGITPIASGIVTIDGAPVVTKPGPGGVQMIFQDPIGSLNPSRSVIDVIAEPLKNNRVRKSARTERATEMMIEVGLDPELFAKRRPSELSGGQAQRVAIGRALLAEPTVLIADEPVSGLDVSIQAGIVNLLHRVTTQRDTALLFVSHDLAVVRSLCDEIVVLLEGRVRENGLVEEVLTNPSDEYTQRLIAAVPTLNDPQHVS